MTNHRFDALNGAVAHLRAALPEADLVQMDDGYLEAVARHALETRASVPWGASVPEDVFKLFTLFPRVNNERLTFYHQEIASALMPRIKGLSMEAAVLEVNHWCFEQASYRSTSARTASPLTVMRAGFARCGEESTLAVSAMRAVGIPARQCYVPRWAHCDDNHAWIEVWIDGAWHYMGACEPEMVIDSGWFTAAASRAMLVHTRAYGMPPEGERVEAVNGREYTVNRTAAYAPTALIRVQVTDRGVPRPGAKVLFELSNMAEFFAICEKTTGADGQTDLLTGLGSLRVRALDGDKSVWTMVDIRNERVCTLDFADAMPLEAETRRFCQVPPAETRIQPVPAPGAALNAHRGRLERAARLREERLARWKTGNPYADRAGGNAAEILAFLSDARHAEADKEMLLDSLAEKDFYDVDRAVLEDALEGALSRKGDFDESVWRQYVLCPRAANEELYPVRRALAQALDGLITPQAVWTFLSEAVSVRELAPPAVFPDSLTALSRGFTGAKGLDVLFVHACRALGMPARLHPATGEKEFFENGVFLPLLAADRAADAALTLTADAPLKYFERFTLSRAEGGRDRTLDFDGMAIEGAQTFALPAGSYRLTAVTRQIDGTVDGVIVPLTLVAGEALEVHVTTPPDATREKLLYALLPPLSAATQGGQARPLPAPGAPSLVAFLAPGEEPTEHFLVELGERKAEFVRRGIAVRLIVDGPAEANHPRLSAVLEGFSGAEILVSDDEHALLDWHRALSCGDLRKPFAAALDDAGMGLFAFSNYFVGSVQALLGILDCPPANNKNGRKNHEQLRNSQDAGRHLVV